MGRPLSCAVLVALAIGCGNPSRSPIDSNDGGFNVDAPPEPGQFGGACSSHTDCESGYCIEPVGAHGGVCSRTCNDDCPQDWECRAVDLPQADVKVCVPAAKQLCLACQNDTECGGGACLTIDGGGRCAIPCSGQCPTGYTCKADASGSHTGNWCQPVTDSCSCSAQLDGAMRSCSNMGTVNGNAVTCFGTQVCSAATGWSTCTANTPASETCDGVDNDCDFVIDDGVSTGASCNITNANGTCVGIQQCNGSSGFTCVGQTPAAEKCDAIDNNCNGGVDETFVAAGLGSSCTAGVGACIRYGSQRCNTAQTGLVCSAVAGSPSAELCNQIDDNCNGTVDEPFKTGAAALGTVCSAGLGVCTQYGSYVCATNGASTTCSVTPNTAAMTTETCNYADDNCDGVVDNGFRNTTTGFYDTDQNCGICGTNCTTMFTGNQAFGQCVVASSAQCVMRCNAGYGNLNGSTIDGCEFQIDATAIYVSVADTTALDDATCGLGPTGTGTGNHPCKSISQGLLRSMTTGRVQILVADGTYSEGIVLLNGKQVKGGYRADTWERHVATTNTVIAGANVSGVHDRTVTAASITSATLFEGFVVRGSFNAKPSGNSYAIYISGSNANLVIRDNQIFGGRGGSGAAGSPGSNGPAGINGAAYAAATYDSFQTNGNNNLACDGTTNNRAAYGGGATACSGDVTSGGNGGGNNCTPSRSTQNSTATSPATAGQPGAGALGGAGGAVGTRGYDADLNQNTCVIPVQGQTGLPMFGTDGSAGSSGLPAAGVGGCSAAGGSVVGNEWVGGGGSTGQIGGNGGGGGGGGAGGGATCTNCKRQGNFFVDAPDLLGGHGGGGGGGGCGGAGGAGGNPGGGSFGIFVVGGSAPTITTNSITLGTGGIGGSGGIGGGGGLGGTGTQGGDQGTATVLFCTGKGGRGGDGGDGGPGSGGGGGCGGSTFGIFTSGVGTPNYCASNSTTGGAIGTGGAGGFSGGNSGGAGASGVLQNCVSL
ncbi:MAG TPA: MopE-related protein [Kofleriaceae bacterium]|nr:MopE-related protein [Kofleriaceae bacterium]